MAQQKITVPLWLAILVPALLFLASGGLLGVAIRSHQQETDARYVISRIESKVQAGDTWQTIKEFLVRMDKQTGETEIMSVGWQGHTNGWQRVETYPPGVAPHFSTSTSTTQ